MNFYKFLLLSFLITSIVACTSQETKITIAENNHYQLVLTDATTWSYITPSGRELPVTLPVFEIDNQAFAYQIDLSSVDITSEPVFDGVTSVKVRSRALADSTISLLIDFRIATESPVLRFRYELSATASHSLTKSSQGDQLTYFQTSVSDQGDLTEVRLSEFYHLPHTYKLNEESIRNNIESEVFGPIVVHESGGASTLMAYEHGSQLPDAFLNYTYEPGGLISLAAVKGNYLSGQSLNDKKGGFQSVWFDLAVINGDKQAMAQRFRDFLLNYISPNKESRKPYIFYNTWNYQERNKSWNGQQYLSSMNEQRILKEIERAKKMGIDVYVIDTGWFGKTGDWEVSSERFPNGLEPIRQKLESYGMKMGLWFNAAAALTSSILKGNEANIMKNDGEADVREIWETEASYKMCLVSDFADDFADELIRVARTTGVRYFKWDAIEQYGCNEPGHHHGGKEHTPQQRANSFAYQLPLAMAKVVDKVCKEFPDAIVDFDITEGERAVGLGFLSAGKYFAINNGPYYYSFDDPQVTPGGGMGANALVFPGISRAANAREILKYDSWIPSVLMLTHYLPDDPEFSQWINLGSLVLGQNGIWGDLLNISDEGVERFNTTLSKYKQVRDDITAAYPVRFGEIGGSPEIHEKINDENGKGAVVIFHNYRNVWDENQDDGSFTAAYTYVTEHAVDPDFWANSNVEVRLDEEGRAIIKSSFKGAGAAIVFFGVE